MLSLSRPRNAATCFRAVPTSEEINLTPYSCDKRRTLRWGAGWRGADRLDAHDIFEAEARFRHAITIEYLVV